MANKFLLSLRRVAYAAPVILLALPLLAQPRKPESRVAPRYPSLARQMHVSGTVKVACTIDAKGKVTKAKAISGHPLLVIAAEDAVMQWKFEPADEVSEMTVEVDFEMAQ